VNDSTLEKLEFDEIRRTLASYCSSGLGKKLALSLTPTTKTKLVKLWLAQVEELLSLVDEHSFPPMAGMHDLREEIRASRFPAPLEPHILAKVSETLMATTVLDDWLRRVVDQAPHIGELGARVNNYGDLAAAINDAVDARGSVRDYASDRLASIRGSIERARQDVRSVFSRLLKETRITRMLQYSGATFHSDRMVLPLKVEYRGRISGIIHRSSDTGSTLFVEPEESVELNNSIIRLRDTESKEITRILTELCRKISEHASGILSTLRAIGVLDLIAAKCRYARKRRCVCPRINDDGIMDLHDARHPVLVELFDQETKEGKPSREVVPIDVRLGDDFDVLVMTGPNTGGKTVAIKTVGLLSLMTQAGIPIPVGVGSRMPIYRKVFVDVGDEQSLQQSLSTFSSHLSNLLSILQQSGAGSLVLIDELGAGTDPDEGAAIGQAIVGELLKLGACAVVTTHLSTLKTLAFNADRVDNACVEFDPQSLRPTYKIRLGEPGNSNALIIAQRLGMAPRLIKQAKQGLDNRHRMLNKAIKGTLASRRAAETARREAREAQLQAQQLHKQTQRQSAELEETQQAFDQWTSWVNTLEAGDEVYVGSLRANARIVRMQLHQQKAVVTSRTMDIEVPLRDISKRQDD